MEQTPPPVNISALKNILAKSKAVMNKIEQISPVTPSKSQSGNESHYINENYNENYNESDEKEFNYSQPIPKDNELQNFSKEHIMASRLPQNIKEAMINKPIPKISMANSSFSLEDVQDVIPKKKSINETVRNPTRDSNLITISRSELKEMMNETLINFLKNNYEKTLTEAAITKTINLLIKEGKINVKKKTL